VITVAAGFPTTVNPILQNRLVPVFVDVALPTYEIDASQLEAAFSEKTRAVFIAHTLGNVFDLDAVTAFVKKHDLWLIEDCCDALGSTWKGRKVGTFGDISTVSFYPAHHITMGEGGAVLTNRSDLQVLIESFRDWGRDCWCHPGKDNTCGKRFDWQLGSLPCGYDHKYTYSHIGYNLKATDMQAALGVSQIGKLSQFIERRPLRSSRWKSVFCCLRRPRVQTPRGSVFQLGFVRTRPSAGRISSALSMQRKLARGFYSVVIFCGSLPTKVANTASWVNCQTQIS
jgi:CDP-6-deoxy-D-xylo-4-hexulose-3-dehydrase